MIREQLGYLFCASLSARIKGSKDLPFGVNDKRYLVRMVDSRPQIRVTHSLQSRVLYLLGDAPIKGYPGGLKLYLTLQRDFCSPFMAVECYATLLFCSECAKGGVKLRKSAKKLWRFPTRAKLEVISRKVFGVLPSTARGNQILAISFCIHRPLFEVGMDCPSWEGNRFQGGPSSSNSLYICVRSCRLVVMGDVRRVDVTNWVRYQRAQDVERQLPTWQLVTDTGEWTGN